MKRLATVIGAIAVLVMFGGPARSQQQFVTPRVSPASGVSQRIGVTDVTVSYHRPGVNGRTIWGGLVPYDQVWRAGANENTTISFSTPVTVGGKQLEAGTYGLHVLPTGSDWTFILSHQYKAWGSFSYDESEDAVRIQATPVSSEHQERLVYTLDDLTPNSAQVILRWEKLSASFAVEVDLEATVSQNLRDGLRGLARFGWQGWNQAAAWCMQNGTNLEEGMAWVERSILMNRNFSNLSVKAGILEQQGNAAEAATIMDEAYAMATEAELNVYGYQLMGRGEIDRAIVVFKRNVEANPESWNACDSLAEAYANAGDTKNAVDYYTRALAMVEDDQQKSRIQGALANLQ